MLVERIDGPLFASLLRQALDWLEKYREEIDRLNVFPVPDGDTGSNMCATLAAAVAAIGQPPPSAIGEVATRAAEGALLGARGNSGVILSQVIRGFAQALAGKETATVEDIARALDLGARLAYQTVDRPTEGTILTVVREAAKEAEEVAQRSRNLLRLLVGSLRAAAATVAETPKLLPLLQEAGVVDAGGRGFAAILEGMRRGIGASSSSFSLPAKEFPRPASGRLSSTYCTEFVLRGEKLDAEELKRVLAPLGESLLVVGDQQLLKVHIHTDHPGLVLEEALKRGSLYDIKIDNMRQQVEKRTKTGVVAVVQGDGFATLFRQLGAVLVEGGATMNPSANDLVKAISATEAAGVLLLPNHPNVVLTAELAKELADREVRVIPTASQPQGLRALLAFDQNKDLEENYRNMQEAAGGTITACITQAVRSTRLEGREIREGDFLALEQDKLLAVGSELEGVVLKAVTLLADGREILTLFWGKDLQREEVEALASRLAATFPQLEIEIQYGGQPHYPLLLLLE
ncbi:DAK2 domain fusion protein YloV [Ammonifex degensii KC4]|uniref:DAK2 domain fusion protein YloV n=1 Tax=Ammonifex degensii (strain DSM 10501 / KC4) TaxID=429009 RepID=C9R910_AMMDK|nr:DAK2 domain-containing protein [Ammonifex degensii]ACX52789.1 DAK2 domain fusion protein YloV [Ammonifex degensii KC4]